jgi:tRNA threonylcarbamoyladenosine biosynthesis protein TsaB
MLILGVDTSGKNGSIALVRFQQGIARTLQIVSLEGGTFSAQLVPQISELLSHQKLGKSEIDGFAVVSGPGSFTGLRVGLAAVKALAEILQKPIAVVSLLEAIAHISGKHGEVVAVLDAGRREAYVAECTGSANGIEVRAQELMTIFELSQSAVDREIVTPDAKLADFLQERGLRASCVPYPRADVIARLGFEKIKAGETISVEALDANYIRRSDAEIKKSGIEQAK